MKRVLVAITALLLVGCANPFAKKPPAEPPAKAAPPAPAQPEFPALAIPPIQGREVKELVPVALQVRPDGKAYALWHALQADGLLVWQEGDSHAVSVSGIARRDVAWMPDGLFFVQLTAVMDGKPQVMRYRWGQPRAEVVIGYEKLKGAPRGLRWDGAKLIFFDDEALKVATPDGSKIEKVAGFTLPIQVAGSGVFAPEGGRYVTVADGKVVLAAPGRIEAGVLSELKGLRLLRVSWAPDGGRVAVELGAPGKPGQVVVFSTPIGSPGREIKRVDGTNPVLLPDRLYYLGAERTVMEVLLPEGDPKPVGDLKATALALQPGTRKLYLFAAGPGPVRLVEMK